MNKSVSGILQRARAGALFIQLQERGVIRLDSTTESGRGAKLTHLEHTACFCADDSVCRFTTDSNGTLAITLADMGK